jgi:hypothetical protein
MPNAPIDQITLTIHPALGDDLETCFRTDTCEKLITYTIDCMIGRYGLDSRQRFTQTPPTRSSSRSGCRDSPRRWSPLRPFGLHSGSLGSR